MQILDLDTTNRDGKTLEVHRSRLGPARFDGRFVGLPHSFFSPFLLVQPKRRMTLSKDEYAVRVFLGQRELQWEIQVRQSGGQLVLYRGKVKYILNR